MALIADSTGNGLSVTGVRRAGPGPVYNSADMELSTHGLPKAFLQSLRTLFDILDDGRRGYVHLSEIESRWRGAEARDLPAGVMESLRRVAPRHGCLSFERFVAGLRYSMFNPENGSKPRASNPRQRTGAECRVRPLGPSNGTNIARGRNRRENSVCPDKHSDSSRYSGGSGRSDPIHTEQNALHVRSIDGPNTVESLALPRSQSESATGFTRRRGPQRRHTITNGVDYGMLKQMKELEQEKDSLMAGLDLLERARDWYQTQIHNITETQRQIGQSRHSTEFLAESCQSRLDVLLPKLQEVTRCLGDLLSCSGKTFPSSGSLSSGSSSSAPPQAIHTLKEHNRLLTQEVTEKSERITQLEQEKSALIKQLFEARARSTHDSSALDSTFI
ncbi:suppressor APC domain-containing protein 2 [Pseudorasbora parva]|uniref:suppressor APC domain-containing protein 2 n=1 Tax=Pseudorasbora parva TaxID=51549 RepID=UPI00351EF696